MENAAPASSSAGGFGRVVVAVLLLVVGGGVAYGGTAVGLSIASGNGDAKAAAAFTGYLAVAFGLPVVIAVRLMRSRHWGWLGGACAAAGLSLLTNLVLLPLAVVAMAM